MNLQLTAEAKRTIQEAAAHTGQTLTDFALATLLTTARRVLQERDATRLRDQDRQFFMDLLIDRSTRPNTALVTAAKRHCNQVSD